MSKMTKRILSLILCFVMLVGVVPVGALATEGVPEDPTAATEQEIVVTEEIPSGSETEISGEHNCDDGEDDDAAPAESEVVTEATEATEAADEDDEDLDLGLDFELDFGWGFGDDPYTVEDEQTRALPSEYDAALIFSDLHTNSSDYKTGTIEGILSGVKDLEFSSVTSGGDAFSVNADSTKYTGKTATITAAFQNVLGNVPVNYVWSDHDRYAVQEDGKTLLDKTSRLVYGAGNDGEYGTEDDDNYYIYALSMGDLCSYDRYKAGFNTDTATTRTSKGFTATVDQAIANFEADAAKLNKDRPLLIVSHQPLFDRRNDNAFAEPWFDAINEVALTMDVAFFFGHNHNYDVAGDYYYARGSEMPVATSEGWQGYETGAGYKGYLPTGDLEPVEKTLNFTHLCAGYMEPTSTGSYSSSGTRRSTVMTVLITDETINFATYDKDGVYDGNYAVDETITRKVTGSMGGESTETPVRKTLTENGVTVEALGMETLYVGIVEEVEESVKALFDGNVVAYDITPNDTYVQGSTAYVTMPIPEGMDADKFGVYHLLSDGTPELTTGHAIDDGKSYEFITNGFSVFVGGELAENGDVGSNPGTANGAMRVTWDLVTNKPYWIVPEDGSDEPTLTGRRTTANNGLLLEGSVGANEEFWYYDGTHIYYGSATGNYLHVSNGNASVSEDTGNTIVNTVARHTNLFSMKAGSYFLNRHGGGSSYRAAGYNQNNDGSKWLFYTPVTFKLANPASMAPGATQKLTYEITLGDGTAVTTSNVNFTTQDTDVVTVSNGELTAKATGTATITATLSSINGSTLKESIVLTTTVAVEDKEVSSVTVTPPYVEVERGTSETQTIGTVTVNYKDNTSGKSFPLTLDMLDGNIDLSTNGTYSMTYTYGSGENAKTAPVTVKVINMSGNNQPEYPDPGSVKVNKTADATYLQKSGLVNVELSTSGLPAMSGADVILMLDTSSSMTKNCIEGHSSSSAVTCHDSRAEVLEESLDNLINQFRTSGPDKTPLDINLAIANFNGYYRDNKSPYYVETNDKVGADNGNQNPSANPVKTGDGTHGAGAFVPVTDTRLDTLTLDYTSGTNYDYAFDAIYQLGTAIKAANGENQRPLYVIFMSDGIPFQWNYYTSNRDQTAWNKWLTGGYTTEAQVKAVTNSDTHWYYYNMEDTNDDGHLNEHRMANAIKGDPSKKFEVIRNASDLGTKVNGKDRMYEVPGLGAKMFAINFAAAAENKITLDTVNFAISSLASPDEAKVTYYHAAKTAHDLDNAFSAIGTEISYAATNAYFVDQMGDAFNLQIGNNITARFEGGDLQTKSASELTGGGISAPVIEVRNYSIYKAQDVGKTINIGTTAKPNNVTVTADMVGKRYGDAAVIEKIQYREVEKDVDGVTKKVTEAFSTLDSVGPDGETITAGQNILIDNVIYAKNFYYNNNHVKVTLTGGIVLEPETFRWNIGIINNVEWAISYYAYLDGSMDGNTSSGSYKTNNYATLYYKNWLGNDWFQETVSPQVGWESANVSYAFYLVDQTGKPVVNQTTGQTGNFINAVKVTSPVVFEEIMLNNLDDIDTIEAKSNTILPPGYDLYDPEASYKVVVLSDDGRGSWTIETGLDQSASYTTYVTGFSGTEASNALHATSAVEDKDKDYYHPEYDYTHTTVWFAVVWVPKALPDTVVIDYGLPVNISVLANDQFGQNGTLKGIGTIAAKEAALKDAVNVGESLALHTDKHASTFTDTMTATYGKAKVNGSKVTYTPTTMDWSTGEKKFDKFAYEVEYDYNEYDEDGNWVADLGTQYYYGDVTVIPATNVYYEDDFVASNGTSTFINYRTYNTETGKYGAWGTEGQSIAGATQAEDRPGSFSLKDIDANNVYGRDQAYDQMLNFSMGSAKKVHVDKTNVAIATFDFYGSGLDIIAMTSNRSGTLIMQIQDATGKTVYSEAVDTYYGYEFVDGKWQPAGSNAEDEAEAEKENGLYQVPVLKADLKTYGKYSVTLHASYFEALDHTGPDGYDLYLDGVRIYDPAGTASDNINDKETIQDVYKQDHEGWPAYQELRNIIIKANDFNASTTAKEETGAIFIDSQSGNFTISDYTSYGPNNELYLANGQSVAFELNLSDYIVDETVKDKDGKTITVKQNIVDDVQIGVKSADGKHTKLRVTADNVSATREFNTSTEMYYSIAQMVDLGADSDHAANDGKTIVILENIGGQDGGIVSITNIKVTFKKEPPTNTDAGYTSWSREIGEQALRMLRDVNEEEKIPENVVPELPESDKEAEEQEKKLQKALEKAAKEAEKLAKKLQKAAKKLLK